MKFNAQAPCRLLPRFVTSRGRGGSASRHAAPASRWTRFVAIAVARPARAHLSCRCRQRSCRRCLACPHQFPALQEFLRVFERLRDEIVNDDLLEGQPEASKKWVKEVRQGC